MQRFSPKRQAILDCLKSTTEHPDAEWIYSKLKALYPKLSLATVYRNLSQLKDAGMIRSVGYLDGKERFDADVSDHTHLVCRECGKTIDVFDVDLPCELYEKVQNATGYRVENAALKFVGVCGECAQKRGSVKND